MKLYLLSLLLLFTTALSAQTSAHQKNSFPYTIRNISFTNDTTILAGSLFLPERAHAAIILVHGSGQEKRMFKLASELAGQGFAVLTYDKRGVGESGGVYKGPEVGTNNIDSANLHLLAADAAAAGRFMLAQPKMKRIPIGLMGFSQAGWIIPLAAIKFPETKFMIMFSGPVMTTLEQLRFQFYTNGNSKFWDTHTETEAIEHTKSDPDRYVFQPLDPRQALSKLNIPGLWIFGAKDIQLPVKLCMTNLDTLSKDEKKYTAFVFPDLDHNTAFSKSPFPMEKALSWIKKL